jgi:uncharacterized protein (TIRG00374 family)
VFDARFKTPHFCPNPIFQVIEATVNGCEASIHFCLKAIETVIHFRAEVVEPVIHFRAEVVDALIEIPRLIDQRGNENGSNGHSLCPALNSRHTSSLLGRAWRVNVKKLSVIRSSSFRARNPKDVARTDRLGLCVFVLRGGRTDRLRRNPAESVVPLRIEWGCGTLSCRRLHAEGWIFQARPVSKPHNMRKQQLRRLAWIAGAAIVAVILYHLHQSAAWKHFEWERVASLLAHVRIRLLAVALIVTSTSYLVRAYRWRFFVDPIKRCSLRTLFAGQVLGFSSIYLIGRAGEAVRPAYIARKERLPFVSQLAVLVLERIYDSFALVLLLALALYFEPLHATSGRSALLLHEAHVAAVVILSLCAALALSLVVFRVYSAPLLNRIGRILNFCPGILRKHLMNFLISFTEGLQVIQTPGDFAASVATTGLLWFLNVSVIWLDFASLGGRLASVSWWAAAFVNFLAALGLLVQVPGVGGGYQVAVLLALKGVLHIPAEAAAGAAILTYLTVMAPCIALGIAFAIYEGLTFKKLRVMARIENEGVVQAPRPESVPQSPSSDLST